MNTDPVVLFATDLEGDVTRGLSVATRLAAERAATLLVVHVIPLRERDGEGMLHDAADLMSGERERDVRTLAPADPSVPHLHVLRVGEPEAEIARVAHESHASLVVMEARARGPLTRLLGPSLSERVSARLECPLVTYQPRSSDSYPESIAAQESALAPSLALQVVLDARVDALVDWLDARARAASVVAAHPSVRHAVAGVAGTSEAGSPALREQVRDELKLELDEHRRANRALGLALWVSPASGAPGATLSHGAPLLSLGLGAPPGSEWDTWIHMAMRDGVAVSLPIEAAAPDEPPIVLAVARVPLPGGAAAALAFAFDARRGFLRILAQPGPSSSAETYAFDEHGLMLSNSRFTSQLRRAGLIAPDALTSRRMRVCDPGPSLLDAAPGAPTETWPLTQMAISATAGRDGVDVRGYRDYRGVPVIGAWRWVPGHRFGVAAEMDLDDARGTGLTGLRRAS